MSILCFVSEVQNTELMTYHPAVVNSCGHLSLRFPSKFELEPFWKLISSEY